MYIGKSSYVFISRKATWALTFSFYRDMYSLRSAVLDLKLIKRKNN